MTSDPPEREARALYDAVMQRIDRSGYTRAEAAQLAGVSVGTFNNLRKEKVPRNSTLRGLVKLGFSYDELARLRTADFVTRYGGGEWPPEVYRLAVKASRLSAPQLQMLDSIADTLLREVAE